VREKESGEFLWQTSGPLIDVGPGLSAADPHVAFKDPPIVFYDGRWHLFGTLRKKSGSVCMEYLNFADGLEGPWRGLADTPAKPFAARENVRQSPEWTASISHGELLISRKQLFSFWPRA